MLDAMGASPPLLTGRTDAGWLLPAIFFVIGLPVAGVASWMMTHGGLAAGSTVGIFGVGFLLLSLRLALETLRARIELHDDHVRYVTPWWSRRLPWEGFEELAIEEVRTIRGGKQSVRRWFSLRPRRRRAVFFTSAWSNAERVATLLTERGIPVRLERFTIDHDALAREDRERDERP